MQQLSLRHLSKPMRLAAVFLISAAFALLGPGLLAWIAQHVDASFPYSIQQASQHLLPLFLQHLLLSLFPIALMVLSALVLKKDFGAVLGLRLKGPGQITAVSILAGILGLMTLFGIVYSGDMVGTLYSLLFYLVVVAFEEEFIFRGLFGALLKDFSAPVRYLLPNTLFALPHIFGYAQFGPLNGQLLFSFVTTQLLGFVVIACFFQFLKEKSGTLWVPILVHACCNFVSIFER